ncbi:MAG: hypothetical protein LBO00_02085 [Zoogloeaceae bacterium]|jgi:hypothetical protein|nr:hypothetical protein [Zoogloeaceae bacterium]
MTKIFRTALEAQTDTRVLSELAVLIDQLPKRLQQGSLRHGAPLQETPQ